MNYIKMLNIIKQYTQIENNPNEVVGTQLNEIFYFVLKNSEGSDAINITTSAIQLAKVTPTSPVTKKKEGIFAIYLPGKYINYGGVELNDNSIGFIIKNKRNEYYIIQYKNPFTSSDGSFDDSTIVTELQANKDMISALQEQLNDIGVSTLINEVDQLKKVTNSALLKADTANMDLYMLNNDIDNTPFVRIDGVRPNRPLQEAYITGDENYVLKIGATTTGVSGAGLHLQEKNSPYDSYASIMFTPGSGISISGSHVSFEMSTYARLNDDVTSYMEYDDLALTQVSFVKYLLKNKLGEILSESDPSNIEQIKSALGL